MVNVKSFLLLLIHLLLMTICLFKNDFSFSIFALFNLSFFLLLVVTVRENQYKSIIFLGVMFWLGFYLKITTHSILRYDYVEPIGNFDFSKSAWDQVFVISSVGALAFTISVIFLPKLRIYRSEPKKIVIMTRKSFLYIGLPLILFGIFCAVANYRLEITMSGLSPKNILPFKLNAISGWFLYQGLIILACFYTKIELDCRADIKRGYFVSVLIGCLSSISVLSRGIFLFHILPFLEVLRVNKIYKFPKRIFILFSVISFIIFILISTFSNALRNSKYSEMSGSETVSHVKYYEPINDQILNSLNQVSRLVLDRWIGAEGMMAVTSYEHRRLKLMTSTFVKALKPGELDVYSDISNSYKHASTKFFFTSLPGFLSFLYYSDSMIIVFFGMSFTVLLLGFIEQTIEHYFNNIFLTSQIGFYLANSIAQFGVAPRPLFINMFMTFSSLIVAYWGLIYIHKLTIQRVSISKL